MKIGKHIIILMSVTVLLAGCSEKSEGGLGINCHDVRLFAEHPTHVWNAGEAVSVMVGRSTYCYKAASEEKTAELIPESAVNENFTSLYALYPYNEDAYSSDLGIRLSHPQIQNVGADVYIDASARSYVSYTHRLTKTTTLAFKDLCSYFRFSINPEDKVVSIVISGGEYEYLSGEIDVMVVDKEPQITVTDGKSSITLNSAQIMSGTYTIPLLPVELQDGLTVHFTDVDGNVFQRKVVAKDKDGKIVRPLKFARGVVNSDSIDFEGLSVPPGFNDEGPEGYVIVTFPDIWK